LLKECTVKYVVNNHVVLSRALEGRQGGSLPHGSFSQWVADQSCSVDDDIARVCGHDHERHLLADIGKWC
jgi:hypothetical protein